jgi:hypothetical protein
MIITSTHSRYLKQLSALATDTLVIETLNSMASKLAWLPAGQQWTRIYGRFNPHQEPFALLVLESTNKREGTREPQVILHVDVFTREQYPSAEHELFAFNAALGWVRARPFPADRAIPTIASVLFQAREPATIVRYRPGRRCTVRFDAKGRSRFAKVYPKKFARHERGPRIVSEATELWKSAEQNQLQFAVAKPLGWDDATRTFWQEKIEGVPVLDQLFSENGERLARKIGTAASSLVLSNLKPTHKFDRESQMAASIRSGKELNTRMGSMASRVDAILDKLEQVHATSESRSLPIHGDLDARQWISDGCRLGLTDFDDFALGDPELDAATFLAELEFENAPNHHIKQLSNAFLTGYESAAGHLNRTVIAAYVAHKRIYKALRLARALQPDGDVQAERVLAHASEALFHDIKSNGH